MISKTFNFHIRNERNIFLSSSSQKENEPNRLDSEIECPGNNISLPDFASKFGFKASNYLDKI